MHFTKLRNSNRHNANTADLAAAFALNFRPAAENLTPCAASNTYAPISLSEEPIEAARKVYKAFRDHHARILNLAGDGIHTLGFGRDPTAEDRARAIALNTEWDVVRAGKGGGLEIPQ